MSLDARLGRGRLGFNFIIVLFNDGQCLGITVAKASEEPDFDHIVRTMLRSTASSHIFGDTAVMQLIAELQRAYSDLQKK